MHSATGPSFPPPHALDVDVCGSVPQALTGRMLGIGRDGVVHSVHVHAGQPVGYRSRRLRTDAAVHNVVTFGGSTLAFGDDSPAFEVSSDLGTLRHVDLAGRGHALAPFPKIDPLTRDLHLVARAPDGPQAHVVISAGALTRRTRLIRDVPNRIRDLTLTHDRVVFVADGYVGIGPRWGEARCTWIATGASAPHPLHTHDAGNTVVLLALTPVLERWTVYVDGGTIGREVLDPTPRRLAHRGADRVDEVPRFLWTTGHGTIGHHDLATARHVHHSLRQHTPGDLVFVTDPQRPGDADAGWLVGFVHDASGTTTEFRVIDAADIARPAIATGRIPRRIPRGLRCTWIPLDPAMTTTAITSNKENGP